jgi:hypothetical protein
MLALTAAVVLTVLETVGPYPVSMIGVVAVSRGMGCGPVDRHRRRIDADVVVVTGFQSRSPPHQGGLPANFSVPLLITGVALVVLTMRRCAADGFAPMAAFRSSGRCCTRWE